MNGWHDEITQMLQTWQVLKDRESRRAGGTLPDTALTTLHYAAQ